MCKTDQGEERISTLLTGDFTTWYRAIVKMTFDPPGMGPPNLGVTIEGTTWVMVLMKFRALRLPAMAAVASFGSAEAFAQADAWMVKEGGAVACRERTLLAEMVGGIRGAMAPGCVALAAGERLVDMAEPGAGFSDMIRVLRHDGSVLYIATIAVTLDPGVGSLSGDRSDEAR